MWCGRYEGYMAVIMSGNMDVCKCGVGDMKGIWL